MQALPQRYECCRLFNYVKGKNIEFSDIAKEEIDKMQKVCDDLMVLVSKVDSNIVGWHSKVACMEQSIDDMTKEYRNNAFERIGDHALNIADAMLEIKLVDYAG